MKVLVLYAHPVETSFGAALHRLVVERLRAKGHTVDDCDLYAEDFDPRLTRAERLGYHDVENNTEPVKGYVERVRRAALDGGNTFDALMHAVRHCTLGEITGALFEVGGRYRRNV